LGHVLRESGPAFPAGRERFAVLDAGGEAGEIFAHAAELRLDHRQQRRRESSPGLGDDGLDQHQQEGVEPICRGEGGGVFHPKKLV